MPDPEYVESATSKGWPDNLARISGLNIPQGATDWRKCPLTKIHVEYTSHYAFTKGDVRECGSPPELTCIQNSMIGTLSGTGDYPIEYFLDSLFSDKGVAEYPTRQHGLSKLYPPVGHYRGTIGTGSSSFSDVGTSVRTNPADPCGSPVITPYDDTFQLWVAPTILLIAKRWLHSNPQWLFVLSGQADHVYEGLTYTESSSGTAYDYGVDENDCNSIGPTDGWNKYVYSTTYTFTLS